MSSHLQPPSREDLVISQVADPNTATTVLTFTLTKPSWIIKGIMIFNETLFGDSDSFAVHP